MRRLCVFGASCWLVWLACATPAFAASVQIQISGAVAKAGTLTLKSESRIRISDAALAAKPLPTAYMLGAAWLRSSLMESQQRLKAGVLFDLASLQLHARRQNKPALVELADNLITSIKPMPVTGRQPALLDPRAVEVNAQENLPLADGDRLYYPLRPNSIRVVGAVRQACTLPQIPLLEARRYLVSCKDSGEADRDIIYIIEPDGRIFIQGIALWNRSPPRALAPGALIYVPFRASATKSVDQSLNSDLAAFLATQVLPDPGMN